MFFLRDFWRRHRRKILVTGGVLGSGYLLYRLYDGHQRRLADLERELARQRENDELIKAQMQAHFENVQRIADTTTLPHAMHYLSTRIEEELDLSHLTERLMKGKGQPNTMSSSEKLELWERLKILSFTRMVVSLCAITILSLYIRVQVNILGRHLYIDTARGLGSLDLIENIDLIERDDQEKFLANADFLANYGMPTLISNIQTAATEVLKGKQLRDFFKSVALHETLSQILHLFMSTGNSFQWVDYLMPQDVNSVKGGSSSDGTFFEDTTKFDQLMAEARAVVSSAEFGEIVERSLEVMVDTLVEDMGIHSAGGVLSSGMPLAKLLPLITQTCLSMVDTATQSRYTQIIRSIPEVELFFTLLYANMPTL